MVTIEVNPAGVQSFRHERNATGAQEIVRVRLFASGPRGRVCSWKWPYKPEPTASDQARWNSQIPFAK